MKSCQVHTPNIWKRFKCWFKSNLVASLSDVVLELWPAQLLGLFLLHWETISLSPLISKNNDLFVCASCGPGGVRVRGCVYLCVHCGVLFLCQLIEQER